MRSITSLDGLHEVYIQLNFYENCVNERTKNQEMSERTSTLQLVEQRYQISINPYSRFYFTTGKVIHRNWDYVASRVKTVTPRGILINYLLAAGCEDSIAISYHTSNLRVVGLYYSN